LRRAGPLRKQLKIDFVESIPQGLKLCGIPITFMASFGSAQGRLLKPCPFNILELNSTQLVNAALEAAHSFEDRSGDHAQP
jgi:hypothetical protein